VKNRHLLFPFARRVGYSLGRIGWASPAWRRPVATIITISLRVIVSVSRMPAALQRPTLILNRNWQPIRVSTVARSLVLVWNDHARIVDPQDFQTYDWSDWTAMAPADGELFIQAVTFRLRVPEVVALTNYDRVPLGKVAFNRRNLFKRDHEMCQCWPASIATNAKRTARRKKPA